jgi:hypothetical protein
MAMMVLKNDTKVGELSSDEELLEQSSSRALTMARSDRNEIKTRLARLFNEGGKSFDGENEENPDDCLTPRKKRGKALPKKKTPMGEKEGKSPAFARSERIPNPRARRRRGYNRRHQVRLAMNLNAHERNTAFDGISKVSCRNNNFNSSRMQAHGGFKVNMDFYGVLSAIGNKVDILDRYNSQKTGVRKEQWRPSEIVDCFGEGDIFVRFEGYPNKYNIWVDIAAEPDRIAPLGTHSSADWREDDLKTKVIWPFEEFEIGQEVMVLSAGRTRQRAAVKPQWQKAEITDIGYDEHIPDFIRQYRIHYTGQQVKRDDVWLEVGEVESQMMSMADYVDKWLSNDNDNSTHSRYDKNLAENPEEEQFDNYTPKKVGEGTVRMTMEELKEEEQRHETGAIDAAWEEFKNFGKRVDMDLEEFKKAERRHFGVMGSGSATVPAAMTHRTASRPSIRAATLKRETTLRPEQDKSDTARKLLDKLLSMLEDVKSQIATASAEIIPALLTKLELVDMQALSLPEKWKQNIADVSSKFKLSLYRYLDEGMPKPISAPLPVPSAPQMTTTPNPQSIPSSPLLPTKETLEEKSAHGEDSMEWDSIPCMDETDERWVPDDAYNACMECKAAFNIFERRHHCRYCGRLLCNTCTEGTINSLRACQECFKRRPPRRPRNFSAIQILEPQARDTEMPIPSAPPMPSSPIVAPSAPPMASSPIIIRAEDLFVGESEGFPNMPLAVAEAIPVDDDDLIVS